MPFNITRECAPKKMKSMNEESNSTDSDVDFYGFNIEPFKETLDVRNFDCGNTDLNEFLTTEEVALYENEGFGTTYLVYYKGSLLAYFTISFDALRVEYLKTVKSFSRLAEMKLESIPSVKIGRLAVDKKWQRRQIGTHLIKYMSGLAITMKGKAGVRLLVLQAKRESIGFYDKCGFVLTDKVGRERGRRNRTMFLDLYKVFPLASPSASIDFSH